MFDHTKFLTVAVDMGKISPEIRAFILKNQSSRRLLGEPHVRSGDLLLQQRMLTDQGCSEILERQKHLRTQRVSKALELLPSKPSRTSLRILMALLAVLLVALARLKYNVPLEPAIVVVTFAMSILETILLHRSGRSLPLSLFRAAFPFVSLMVLSLILIAAVSIWRLDSVVALHTSPVVRVQVDVWLGKIKLAFAAMAVAISILLIYSIWKFHSLQFAESRFGATKDILIRVESILGDETQALADRQDAAITVVLKGIRNVIRLSITDRAMRRILFFRPSANQSRVLYYVPDPPRNCFRLQGSAYPEQAPERVGEAFEWLRRNHCPSALNEIEFEKLKQWARGKDPQGWEQRYLNTIERHQHISVCGWIYDKQETLMSMNASQSLVLDNSFLQKLEEQGFGTEVLQWLEIASFVGCPIVGKGQQPAGVLLVIKNIRNGFAPEDLEVVITASQILGRILQS